MILITVIPEGYNMPESRSLNTPQEPTKLFSYKRYWAHRFTPAPILPMTRAELDELKQVG